jgi:polyisoprenoid-binding protein YceI
MVWEIDPAHTLVEFAVDHLAINLVKGHFDAVEGVLHLDTKQPENSWVRASVNTASIYPGIAQRDVHLRSSDFFDVEKYPTITFESIRVRRTGPKSGAVVGNLTIRNITRVVSFQTDFTGYARDPMTGYWKMGLAAVATVDRRMFDMRWTQILEAGISLIGFETRIELRVEAIQSE